TFTTASNANGSATVTVTLSDDGSGVDPNVNTSSAQTFSITVNAIIDVSAFTKVPDQTVNEDAGAQTVTGWATGISDGDPDLTQTVGKNVMNGKSEQFLVQPGINNVVLGRYSPASNYTGSATETGTYSETTSGIATNVNFFSVH